MPRGAKPVLTPEQDREVLSCYRAGQTLRQIAADYGVSDTAITSALDRCGQQRRTLDDYRWKPTAENVAEVVRLWHKGFGVQKIARQVGTGNAVVSQVLRDAGIQTRLGGAAHPRFKRNEIDALVAEYETSDSLSEMARRYDCSTTVIRKTLQRAGVQIRQRGTGNAFWTPERIEWLLQQHEAGRSQAAIGRDIGVTQGTIGRRLREFGILKPTPQAKGADHGQWKGGRTLDGSGYVLVKVTEENAELAGPVGIGNYIREHRLVMARMLGRALRPDETVHHKNGHKQDNDPGNLQLRQGHHGKGVRVVCLDCGSRNIGHETL